MNFSRNDEIAGVPALTARDLLRKMMNTSTGIISTCEAASLLKMTESEAVAILQRFETSGLVTIARVPGDDEDHWEITSQGHRVALATAAKRVRRRVAEEAVRTFLQRVSEVNASDFAYIVAEVRVFGSYLSDEDRLGDVDLAVRLRPRYVDAAEQFSLRERRINDALGRGRRFRNVVQHVCWPEQEVWLHLKSGSRVLSLHDHTDEVLNWTRSEILFQEDSAQAPNSDSIV